MALGHQDDVSPDRVEDPARDIVLVSKGHSASGVYAVMGHAGYFPLEWLDDYYLDGSHLGGHVTAHGIPGVELSTGALGHALPFGVGYALTGSLAIAGAMTLVEPVVNTVAHYFFDKGWDRWVDGRGAAAAPAAPAFNGPDASATPAH